MALLHAQAAELMTLCQRGRTRRLWLRARELTQLQSRSSTGPADVVTTTTTTTAGLGTPGQRAKAHTFRGARAVAFGRRAAGPWPGMDAREGQGDNNVVPP